MTLQDCYSTLGGDYADVMHRFTDEARVARFLAMFLKDKSYALLGRSLRKKDYQAAFQAAHTMKGICINLSLTSLWNACDTLADNLCDGHPDQDTAGFLDAVKKQYLQTTSVIRRYLNTNSLA